MPAYEYRVTSAPRQGVKAKGLRRPEARFAFALEAEMNRMAAEGWEYVRSDTLPCEERQGWFKGKATVSRTVLVFRRALPEDAEARPASPPAYVRPVRPGALDAASARSAPLRPAQPGASPLRAAPVRAAAPLSQAPAPEGPALPATWDALAEAPPGSPLDEPLDARPDAPPDAPLEASWEPRPEAPAAPTLPPFMAPPPVAAPPVAPPPVAPPPVAAPLAAPPRDAAPALGPAATTILASPRRAQVPPFRTRDGEGPAVPPLKPFGKASG